MSAKLESTFLDIAAQEVRAVVVLAVQGQTFRIACSMTEQELLQAAADDNRTDWSCADVALIAANAIGQPVTLGS